MPNEAQLKAQMQAAIAAKKKKASETESDSESQKPADSESQTTNVSTKPVPEVKLPQNEAPQPPPIEVTVSDDNPPSSHDRRPPVAQDIPTTLTFFGQAIRFTTHRKDVYFAIDDILPLSNNAEAQSRYIEYKNQPSTREKAESIIKNITFTGENGIEKLDGSKAGDIIRILLELKLSSPGPLGNWLDEISTRFKPTDDKSAE